MSFYSNATCMCTGKIKYFAYYETFFESVSRNDLKFLRKRKKERSNVFFECFHMPRIIPDELHILFQLIFIISFSVFF